MRKAVRLLLAPGSRLSGRASSVKVDFAAGRECLPRTVPLYTNLFDLLIQNEPLKVNENCYYCSTGKFEILARGYGSNLQSLLRSNIFFKIKYLINQL